MTTTQDRQRALLQRIQTEGVEAAYQASLAVCSDPKAPAPARATASATLFRVAGYFDRSERGETKQPHEMTSEELASEIKRLAVRMERSDESTEPGIFD